MMEYFELEMLCTLATRFSEGIAGKLSILVFQPSATHMLLTASIVTLELSSEVSYHCHYSVCWPTECFCRFLQLSVG